MKRYLYGMTHRPFGMLCQPDDAEHVVSFQRKGRYWSIIAYKRLLSEEDVAHYDLELLGEEEER